MSHRFVRSLCVLVFSAFMASVSWCSAFYEATPIQLSLWAPVQLFSEDRDVVGLRLGFHSVNERVSGLDIGLWNQALSNQRGVAIGAVNTVDGGYAGFQYGIANLVGETLSGWQGGFFNMTQGEVVGLQTGPMNMGMTVVRGVQIGVVNYAQDMSGFQLGLFNAAQVMYGLQIGLVNIISDKEHLPVMPFLNAAF